MKLDEICGYCLSCKEWKDDDYGAWCSDRDGLPLILMETGKVKQIRACRDCGWELLSIEDAKKVCDHLTEVLAKLALAQMEGNEQCEL